MARAGGGSGRSVQAAIGWRPLAQALVDVGQPASAGRVVRARMQAEAPLDATALELLSTVTLASDAAAGGRAEAITRQYHCPEPLPILPRN